MVLIFFHSFNNKIIFCNESVIYSQMDNPRITQRIMHIQPFPAERAQRTDRDGPEGSTTSYSTYLKLLLKHEFF